MSLSRSAASNAPVDGGIAPPHPALVKYYKDESERPRYLRAAFDRTARHYDRINRTMSLGTDNWYRREALWRGGVAPGMKLLDVGCGTGIVSGHARKMVGPHGMVVGVDPSIGMLEEAIRRDRVPMPVNGMGEYLPFSDETFDFVCMSYALRHVSDLVQTFREFRRVLKPDGTLLLLEMTPPAPGLRFQLLKFYMRRVVPAVTRLGTVSRETQILYTYCWDTFEHCVSPDDILRAMHDAGLRQARRHVELRIFSEYTARR